MTLFHLIVDSQPVLDSFSPVEVLAAIVARCKGKGELPIDVYTTEVK